MLALLLGTLALAGTLQVDVLDIGQGDSILLRSPEGKVVLIDGGTGGDAVPPMLRARGVERIDLMIATHPHSDHIGGLDEVIEEFPVGLYIDSGQTHTTATYDRLMDVVESKELRYLTAEPGQVLNLGEEVQIELLHPGVTMLSGTRSDLNSNSVVARVTHGDNCFLFTGDAEEPTEQALLSRGMEPCNVLKVAHHGGAHSTHEPWLRAVQPQIALISAGEGNRYKHPREETLHRLERAGAEIYRTDTMGAIHLESDGSTVTVSTERGPNAAPVPAPPPQAAQASSSTHAPEPPPQTHSSPQPAANASASGKVDINAASQDVLETLPGIGPSKAGAIIEYRSTNGPFSDIEQLDDVPGIGAATMSNLRPLVSIGSGSDGAAAAGEGGINVNTAGQDILETLPGIGPAKAGAIIEYRNANGPFSSCDDLARVSGIGPATVSKVRGMCTVGTVE